jgi:nucleoside-diphosphate-sugar epimerase
MKRSVVITGGTGFIGSHIVRAFCSRGVRPKCLVRRSSDLGNLKELDIELRYGDVRAKETLVRAFEGCSTVVHNAALVSDWGKYSDFYATNVQGTLNVMEASLQTGIKDIIMAGSNAVYGEEKSRKIKDELSPLSPHYRYFLDSLIPCKLNYYRDTKAEATEMAARFAKRHGLNLTILDPVWVYGEREFHTGFYEYLRAVKEGIPFMPGCKRNKFHVVYAGDLADAYYAAFRKRLRGVHRVIIGNERAVPMHRIYRLFCQKAQLKMPINLPKVLIYPLGFLMEVLFSALGSGQPPLLTRGRVNLFYDSIEYCVGKSKAVLGYTSRYTLEQGIEKTVSWYKKNHLL